MNYIRFITAFLFLNCMVFADKDFVVPNSYTTKEWKTKEGGNFLYRTAKPTKLAKGKKYPLLVFFHGAGGRGNDNIKQLLDAGGGNLMSSPGKCQAVNAGWTLDGTC